MRLVLHLLRKDIRQWWYEIGVTISVQFVAAFTAGSWRSLDASDFVETVTSFMTPLLLVLLVGRVLQAERWPSPFEDWRTRPVPRRSIAAAKSLFVVLFAILPTWLSYLVTLQRMGYSAAVWLRESPSLLLTLVAFFLLPAAAVMAVTTNLGQSILTTVGLVLAMFFLAAGMHSASISGAVLDSSVKPLMLFSLAAVALLTLYWQIIRDRTWIARTFLIAGCMLFQTLPIGVLALRRVTSQTTMPATLQSIAPRLIRPDAPLHNSPPQTSQTFVQVHFPVAFGGIPDDVKMELENGKAVLRGRNGDEHQVSLWLDREMLSRRGNYKLAIRDAEYAALSQGPVDIDLYLWASVYSMPTDLTGTVANRRLVIPDLFECALDPANIYAPNVLFGAECTTARTSLGRVDFTWTEQGSPISLKASAIGTEGLGFWRSIGGSALRQRLLSANLRSRWQDGTQIHIRHYKTVHQWHKTVHLSNVRLDDYRQTE